MAPRPFSVTCFLQFPIAKEPGLAGRRHAACAWVCQAQSCAGWEAPPAVKPLPAALSRASAHKVLQTRHIAPDGWRAAALRYLLFPKFEVQTGNCECRVLHRADRAYETP